MSNDYENPLIVVMGDLIKNGVSGTIGEPEKLIEIYCGGSISGTPIYYFPSEIVYTFDYPEFIVSDYLAAFKDKIDTSSSKYILNSSLILNKAKADSGYSVGDGVNQIDFHKDINNNYILEITGNIFVTGDIKIGEIRNEYTIYYKGEGKLFSTNDIIIYSKLIPILNVNSIPPLDIENIFPEESLLFLIADHNIELNVVGTDNGISECLNSDLYIIGIANNQIIFNVKGLTLRGTLIGGKIVLDTGSGELGKICYDEKISENLPDDTPGSSTGSGDITFSQVEWQELAP